MSPRRKAVCRRQLVKKGLATSCLLLRHDSSDRNAIAKNKNKIARRYYTSLYKDRVVLSRYRDLKLLVRPPNNLDRSLKRGLHFERDQLELCLSAIDSERIEWFIEIGAQFANNINLAHFHQIGSDHYFKSANPNDR